MWLFTPFIRGHGNFVNAQFMLSTTKLLVLASTNNSKLHLYISNILQEINLGGAFGENPDDSHTVELRFEC
jgi:hypothetical protein